MSIDALRNHVRIEALRAGGRSVSSGKGVVTSYDPNRYAAKVFLMPEGAFPEETGEVVESGWIPIQTQWSGNGWGMYCPPSPGDQVTIEFIEGDTSSPEIVGRVFDLAHLPLNVPSGECWLVHASGAFLKLTNDGKLSLQDGHGSSLVFNDDGTATLTLTTLTIAGNLRVTGAVIGGYGSGDQVGLQTHTHNQPPDSHGDTEQPTGAPNAGT